MNNLKFLTVAAIGMAALVSFNYDEPVESSEDLRIPKIISPTDPPCLQMYFYIEQYADSFNIPKKYAYGIAHSETGYRGPFHWKYNHAQTSFAGAEGPMQIMLPTARWNNNDNISRERLRNDIEYNVRTSMKVLRKLYNKYKNWKLVFGCYNTGRPCVNGYAEKVFNHKLNW
jgi:soluble lytic murein transglycosylase-like protein